MRHIYASDAASNRTADIQRQLDDARWVYFEPGLYRVGSLRVRSNSRVTLAPGAILLHAPGQNGDQILSLEPGAERVLIEGGTIDGNKAEGPGQQVQCIGISGGKNITIRDIELRNAPQDGNEPHTGNNGDGLYVGSGGGVVSGLRVENVYAHGNERHGVFVVSCIDSLFDGLRIENTNGYPGSGLNLEPNYASEILQRLTFRSVFVKSCLYGLTAQNHYGGDWRDILFDDCHIDDNVNHGASCGGAGKPGVFRFRGGSVSGNGGHGIELTACVGVSVDGVAVRKNAQVGINLFECLDFSVSGCSLNENNQNGLRVAGNIPRQWKGSIHGNSIFNSPESGIHVTADWPGFDGPCGLQISHNRLGTDAAYGERVQQWGLTQFGRMARGIQCRDNLDCGNTLGLIREWPSGDANTVLTTDCVESFGGVACGRSGSYTPDGKVTFAPFLKAP